MVAVVLVAFLVTGCSHAVPMPRSEWKPADGVEPGSYRIRLQGRVEYLVSAYGMTDSTVVIVELLPSDERYAHGREDLPIFIPLAQVDSISRMELNKPMTALAATAAIAITAFFTWLFVDFSN